MSALPARVAQDLGRRLRAAGFQPLPDLDAGGELIGTRLRRVCAGYVEYLALRPSGLAHAVRVEATFDYQRPTEHGAMVEHLSGHAVRTLVWLLTSAEAHSGDLPRPYVSPCPSGKPHERGRT